MERFIDDDRLNPSHVSMYLALFQYWNLNRFKNPVSISRGEIMKLCKIRSGSTYLKVIKELDTWGYISYDPSYNPFKGSQVSLFNLQTGSKQVSVSTTPKIEQVVDKNHSEIEQVVTTSKREETIQTIVNDKHDIPKSLEEVKEFFSSMNYDLLEADKFYNYFESNGWLVSGKSKMQNWKAAARNWIMRSEQYKSKSNSLHASNQKDYSIPL